jgi:hypothetical protein
MAYDDMSNYETQSDRLGTGSTGSGSSFKLKASVQTYELTLKDLTEMFSRELGVPASRITITDKQTDTSGYQDRHSSYSFAGLIVTVKNS